MKLRISDHTEEHKICRATSQHDRLQEGKGQELLSQGRTLGGQIELMECAEALVLCDGLKEVIRINLLLNLN